MSPGAPGSPNRSCQEPVSTARRHERFADALRLRKDPKATLIYTAAYSLLF